MEKSRNVDGKLCNLVSEIFCIFYAYYISAAGGPLKQLCYYDAELFLPSCGLSLSLYEVLTINSYLRISVSDDLFDAFRLSFMFSSDYNIFLGPSVTSAWLLRGMLVDRRSP